MVTLYVEGGGDTTDLKSRCREGFREFITKAGVTKRPRIFACGGRDNAFEDYCTAIENGEEAMLLVDSEAPIDPQHQTGALNSWKPWDHLRNRDGWKPPARAADSDCHLMVQVMESWFIADRQTLKKYFGNKFHDKSLPAVQRPIEQVGKKEIYDSLEKATKNCSPKGVYGKGSHSFQILKDIDPSIVQSASDWTKRFIDELKNR